VNAVFDENCFNALHFVTETAKYLMTLTPIMNQITITAEIHSFTIESRDNEIILEEAET